MYLAAECPSLLGLTAYFVELARNQLRSSGRGLDFDSAEFAVVWDKGWSSGTRMGVLGFRVSSREEVDNIYRDLTEAGYSGEQEPYDTFWGARYAVVQDPDGNPVGIMSPVDPARRSPQTPPES